MVVPMSASCRVVYDVRSTQHTAIPTEGQSGAYSKTVSWASVGAEVKKRSRPHILRWVWHAAFREAPGCVDLCRTGRVRSHERRRTDVRPPGTQTRYSEAQHANWPRCALKQAAIGWANCHLSIKLLVAAIDAELVSQGLKTCANKS